MDVRQVYEELRTKDRKLHKNLGKILKEMLRGDPAEGLGKPKPLKHNLSGARIGDSPVVEDGDLRVCAASRRLSPKDRLIYKFDDRYIYIFALGGHYEQF
ncbi:MAG: type II toxin-antitoxin system YoeB family toxin [Cyanobacteria bacterium P01_A01_bin.83]